MFLTIIAFIIVLGILILAHESGHFIIAKLSGVKVLEFAIGFPPRIFSFKRHETKYTIGLLPLGGYVQMLGEEKVSKDPRSFNRQKPLSRLAISIAGVLMNLILAWLILTIGFSIGMTPLASSPDQIPGTRLSEKIYIAEVSKDSPAEKSGLYSGDTIISGETSAGKTVFKSAQSVTDFTAENSGKEVTFEIGRDNQVLSKKVTLGTESGAQSGIAMVDQVVIRVPWYKAPVVAFQETYRMFGFMFDFLRQFFGKLFFAGQISDSVGGPVAIFDMSGAAARAGAMIFFQFIAMLSVNLAIINILPFPALDGGRALFILLEKIFGKRIVKEEIENIIHTVGFALLILLILAITYKDILRLIHR